MDVDPRTNVVVFQLNHAADALLIGQAPTLAEDGVSQAWEGARHGHGTQAEDVVALHTEWEPSPADTAFIEATFRDATVTFNFPRPAPADWEEALKAAEATMPAAADREPESMPTGHSAGHRGTPASGEGHGQDEVLDHGVEADGIAAHGEADAHGELLPMLWSQSSPDVGKLTDMPHWPVAAGRLHLALAVVALTPRGTVGRFPVSHQQLGEHSFNALLAEACENLAAKLRVGVREVGDEKLLALTGPLIAAAVCLPDFYRRLSALTKADRLVVGVPWADEIYVAAADSAPAAAIHRLVKESEHPATELVPSVLTVEGDHLEILFEQET